MNTFGKRLKYYRELRCLTQRDVADSVDASISTYQKYESDERSPKSDRVVALAKTLNVYVGFLQDGEETMCSEMMKQCVLSSAQGDGFVDSFWSEFSYYENISKTITDFLRDWQKKIIQQYPEFATAFFKKGEINLPNLIELGKRQRSAVNHYTDYTFDISELMEMDWYRLAFCIATSAYLAAYDGKNNDILQETIEVSEWFEPYEKAAELPKEDYQEVQIQATQYFAIKVFIPYLANLMNALDAMVQAGDPPNTFENYFIYGKAEPGHTEVKLVDLHTFDRSTLDGVEWGLQ